MDDLNKTTLEELLSRTVEVETTTGEKVQMSPDFRVSVQRMKDD